MNEEDRLKSIEAITAERWRIAFALSAAMLVLYFGFILLVAFNKPVMGYLIMPGLTLGILMGASVIVLAWFLTLIYVRWANKVYDEKIAKLRR